MFPLMALMGKQGVCDFTILSISLFLDGNELFELKLPLLNHHSLDSCVICLTSTSVSELSYSYSSNLPSPWWILAGIFFYCCCCCCFFPLLVQFSALLACFEHFTTKDFFSFTHCCSMYFWFVTFTYLTSSILGWLCLDFLRMIRHC